MSGSGFANFGGGRKRQPDGSLPPPRLPRQRPGFFQTVVVLALALVVIYGGYVWIIKRVVVGPSEVLVLLKKDGSKSLPGDEVIVPRAPDQAKDPVAYQRWAERYDGCNG